MNKIFGFGSVGKVAATLFSHLPIFKGSEYDGHGLRASLVLSQRREAPFCASLTAPAMGLCGMVTYRMQQIMARIVSVRNTDDYVFLKAMRI